MYVIYYLYLSHHTHFMHTGAKYRYNGMEIIIKHNDFISWQDLQITSRSNQKLARYHENGSIDEKTIWHDIYVSLDRIALFCIL